MLRHADHGRQMGGAVEGSDTSEFGYAEIQSVTEDRLFQVLPIELTSMVEGYSMFG